MVDSAAANNPPMAPQPTMRMCEGMTFDYLATGSSASGRFFILLPVLPLLPSRPPHRPSQSGEVIATDHETG
jgi:hypothetical protein